MDLDSLYMPLPQEWIKISRPLKENVEEVTPTEELSKELKDLKLAFKSALDCHHVHAMKTHDAALRTFSHTQLSPLKQIQSIENSVVGQVNEIEKASGEVGTIKEFSGYAMLPYKPQITINLDEIEGESPIATPQHTPDSSPTCLVQRKEVKQVSTLQTSDATWLWQELERLTQLRIRKDVIVFLPHSPVTDRFSDVSTPRHSALFIDDKIFNANRLYLREGGRVFIAAQYPQEPRKDPGARELFWRSAFMHGSIVDLTQLHEPGITPYYPTAVGEALSFGSMQIECKEIISLAPHLYESRYLVTDYEHNIQQSKEIKRVHYFDWQDHTQASLPMLYTLVKILESQPLEQTCVHCRAGVGRTGTLIAAYYLKKQIERGNITYQNLGEGLISLICDLRMQRGPFFVQKPTQLNQLLEFGRLILKESEKENQTS